MSSGLTHQRALLREFPRRIADRLSEDERVAAVWLGGSLGRGEGDALSDIDLLIVGVPGRTTQLVQDLERHATDSGPVALVHEAPQNAPIGGAQMNVLYDTRPVPVYVDWNVWPAVASRPCDVSVLFERTTFLANTETFESMLAGRPCGQGRPLTPDVLNRFRVFMVPIVVKHAVRGWFESVDRMLEYMRIPAPPATSLDGVATVARGVLEDCGGSEPDTAVACIERCIGLIAEGA